MKDEVQPRKPRAGRGYSGALSKPMRSLSGTGILTPELVQHAQLKLGLSPAALVHGEQNLDASYIQDGDSLLLDLASHFNVDISRNGWLADVALELGHEHCSDCMVSGLPRLSILFEKYDVPSLDTVDLLFAIARRHVPAFMRLAQECPKCGSTVLASCHTCPNCCATIRNKLHKGSTRKCQSCLSFIPESCPACPDCGAETPVSAGELFVLVYAFFELKKKYPSANRRHEILLDPTRLPLELGKQKAKAIHEILGVSRKAERKKI